MRRSVTVPVVQTLACATLWLTLGVPARVRAQQPSPTTPIVFKGVTVIDVQSGKRIPEQLVVIEGNRIQRMGGADKVSVPSGARVVDARGKYLIPGLWDMHVHSARYATDVFYPLLLANGVTGIRDPGSPVPLDTLLQWRREIVAGSRIGPVRQVLSGQYISEEGNNGASKPCERSKEKGIQTCVSSTRADAQHLVDSLKAAGVGMIKPYNVSPEIYFALAAEARKQGLPFGGHIYPGVGLIQASDSGAQIIDHMGLGYARSSEIDSDCLGQGRINVASDALGTVAKCRPVAERFQHNGTWWVPTLSGLDEGGPPSHPILESLHKFSGGAWWSDTTLHGNWIHSSLANGTHLAADSLGYLHIIQSVGLPLLAGTDVTVSSMQTTLPGFSLHAELAMYVMEGLTPLAALQTATLNPAKFLHATDSLGTVAEGKLADVVLLDADPLADISNTTMIRAVVANGRYFDRAELDQLVSDAHAKAQRKGPPNP